MKARNSLLESVQLSPSRPAYRWKTASRDSMQRSVSVGCRSKGKFRRALRGALGLLKSNLTLFLEEGWAEGGLLQLLSWRSLLCPTCPAAFFFGISFSDALARHHGKDPEDWGVVHGKCPGEMPVPIRGVSRTGKSLRCNHSDVLVFSMLSSMAWLELLFWKDKPASPLSIPLPCLDGGEILSHKRKMRAELAPQTTAPGQGWSWPGLWASPAGIDRAR